MITIPEAGRAGIFGTGDLPPPSRPDAGEVRYPFLVGRIGLELAVRHIVSNRTALAIKELACGRTAFIDCLDPP